MSGEAPDWTLSKQPGSEPAALAGWRISLLSLFISSSKDLTSGCFLSVAASGHPHCFFCHLELGSDREVPSRFANYVNVEFSMPTTSASKAAVRSVSVEDKPDVRKWVNYSAHYSYKVEIEQKKSLKPDFEGEDLENPKECGVQ